MKRVLRYSLSSSLTIIPYPPIPYSINRIGSSASRRLGLGLVEAGLSRTPQQFSGGGGFNYPPGQKVIALLLNCL